MNISQELLKLLDNSYAPYSNHQVAAIVIDEKGKKFAGVNVENSSFGATSCAERNAIFNAISSGQKMGNIKEVHLMARHLKIDDKDYYATPCGICRQVISEASNNEANVFMHNQKGGVKEMKIDKLIPSAFKKEMLKIGKS